MQNFLQTMSELELPLGLYLFLPYGSFNVWSSGYLNEDLSASPKSVLRFPNLRPGLETSVQDICFDDVSDSQRKDNEHSVSLFGTKTILISFPLSTGLCASFETERQKS